MPVTPTFPGVYIEEVPSGVRTITGVATSIAAFVGFTARGPVDRPVRMFNPGDFERTFGALHRDSEVAYAVRQFFENGGTDCYVVRVAAGAASAHEHAALRDRRPATTRSSRAAPTPGAGGTSSASTSTSRRPNPDSLFNVHVVRHELQGGALVAAEVEQFRNLSMNSRSATYAPAVVGASRLIRLTRPAGLAFDTRGFALTGDLGTFPTVAADQTTIEGVLDGFEPFTLVLPSPPTSAATLLTRLNTAISNAGLTGRLVAERADAAGATLGSGNHLKLTSQAVAGNPSTDAEFSSVEIVRAAENDASAVLTFGLVERRAPGRRQREPAAAADRHAQRRPLDDPRQRHHRRHRRHRPGPLVGRRRHRDRADGLAAGGGVEVGPALRDELQSLIRSDPGPVDGERRSSSWPDRGCAWRRAPTPRTRRSRSRAPGRPRRG